MFLITQTARQAGHAGVVREGFDGRRAGHLDEAYESARTS